MRRYVKGPAMADVDVELELQVLRVNVGGILGDVHEVKARQRSDAVQFTDAAQQHARFDRLLQRIERIRERLAALELRCDRQPLAAAEQPADQRPSATGGSEKAPLLYHIGRPE